MYPRGQALYSNDFPTLQKDAQQHNYHIYKANTPTSPIATAAAYPTTAFPAAAFVVAAGAADPVADPVWLLDAVPVTPEVAPVASEDGTAEGRLLMDTPAAAQSLWTAGAMPRNVELACCCI